MKIEMIVLLFVVILISGNILSVLSKYGNLLSAKTEKVKKEIAEGIPLTTRMVTTSNYLTLIDHMIELYILDIQKIQMTLKKPFNALKIDEDVERLSNFIHDSLDGDVFTDTKSIIVTSKYLEEYIVSASLAALMTCYKETNQQLAQLGFLE